MILSHLAYRSASCRLRNCNMRHVAHWWVPECSKNYRWVCIILICIRVTSCDHVLVLFPTFRSLDKRKNVGFRISGVAATPCLLTPVPAHRNRTKLALRGSSFSQGAVSRPRMRAVSGTVMGKLWPLGTALAGQSPKRCSGHFGLSYPSLSLLKYADISWILWNCA